MDLNILRDNSKDIIMDNANTETFKMAERVSTAIYFLTNFFNDEEPLRWELRTEATRLVQDKFKDKFSALKDISAMLSLAKRTGLVSDVNHDILIGEIDKLTGEYKRLSFPLNIEETSFRKLTVPEKFNVKDRTNPVKKNTRQEAILSIIKNKKEVMIKDISSQFNGYSDKTIQRELFGMVKDGILIKSGEKRWSRYSLRG